MKEIGRVIHISPSKKAVIKAHVAPRIGEIVFDEKQKPVGRVFDTFGPTVLPYVSVEARNPEKLVDSILYISPSPRHVTKRKRRK